MKRNGFILVASDNSKIGGWSEEDRSIHFVKILIFEVLDDDVDTSFNRRFMVRESYEVLAVPGFWEVVGRDDEVGG